MFLVIFLVLISKKCVLYRFNQIILLNGFLGRSAFPNISEILSDVHGDLQKDLLH